MPTGSGEASGNRRAHPVDRRRDELGVGLAGIVGIDGRSGLVRARLQPVPRVAQRIHRLAGARAVVDHRRHRPVEVEVDDGLARDDDVEVEQLLCPAAGGDDHDVGVELIWRRHA